MAEPRRMPVYKWNPMADAEWYGRTVSDYQADVSSVCIYCETELPAGSNCLFHQEQIQAIVKTDLTDCWIVQPQILQLFQRQRLGDMYDGYW